MKNQIQDMVDDFYHLTKRVDKHGNTYRSISESRYLAIDKAKQHLANGGDPNCQKIICMLVWS